MEIFSQEFNCPIKSYKSSYTLFEKIKFLVSVHKKIPFNINNLNCKLITAKLYDWNGQRAQYLCQLYLKYHNQKSFLQSHKNKIL